MFEEVKAELIKQLKLKDVQVLPESRFKEDLGADSIDTLQLLMTIEEKYGITIPDEKLATFATVQDIVDYLEKQTKND
ncbi:MAG: acyl carrier protein [Eubacterium sp.]|nr:acyl carrier protein [Eubacterium sp.]HCA22033.1 acyl carrier protein [Lachnospiraceae bacterium]